MSEAKAIGAKFQIPNSKLQSSARHQILDAACARLLEHELWNVFGTWNLELETFISVIFPNRDEVIPFVEMLANHRLKCTHDFLRQTPARLAVA